MREIKYIVIHCTATQKTATVASILNYWRTQLGWKNPGYHYIIDCKGTIKRLIGEGFIANGVAGYNSHAIHVSYIGGVDKKNNPMDTRTPEQLWSMELWISNLKERFPKAIILGHRDFPGVTKACPSFDVKTWLAQIKI